MSEPVILDTSVIRRAQDVIATEVDGEAVLLSIERGQCYGFDAIGTRIWSLIEEPVAVRAMLSRLLAEFDVEPETCRQDVTRLLAELVRERLIVVEDDADR